MWDKGGGRRRGGEKGRGERRGGGGADLELCLISVIDLPPHRILGAEVLPQSAQKDPTVEATLKLCHWGKGRRQDNLHPPGVCGGGEGRGRGTAPTLIIPRYAGSWLHATRGRLRVALPSPNYVSGCAALFIDERCYGANVRPTTGRLCRPVHSAHTACMHACTDWARRAPTDRLASSRCCRYTSSASPPAALIPSTRSHLKAGPQRSSASGSLHTLASASITGICGTPQNSVQSLYIRQHLLDQSMIGLYKSLCHSSPSV